MHLTGKISEISRGSLHDGPGIRTVVYFKGCGLRCEWCHNPETISSRNEIVFIPIKCIGCKKCIDLCPNTHKVIDGVHVFDRNNCTSCGKCTEVCPANALSVCGKTLTVNEIMEEVLKDKHYYASSGGGITLSGGECLLQAEFCRELLKACKKQCIHTTIETALNVSYYKVEEVLPYTDLFFTDLKIADSEKHLKYTGVNNQIIINNLTKLSFNAKKIIVRIPIIPSVNDTVEDMINFSKILNCLGNKVYGIELLKYNPLAQGKYESIDKPYTSFSKHPQDDNAMILLKDTLSSAINHKYNVYF